MLLWHEEQAVELICIQGAAPGAIVATLAHGACIRQVPMSVARHPAGGWRVELPDGGFGPRCHAVATAVLMQASEVFADDDSGVFQARAA